MNHDGEDLGHHDRDTGHDEHLNAADAAAAMNDHDLGDVGVSVTMSQSAPVMRSVSE
jgi:hypothetical protein